MGNRWGLRRGLGLGLWVGLEMVGLKVGMVRFGVRDACLVSVWGKDSGGSGEGWGGVGDVGGVGTGKGLEMTMALGWVEHNGGWGLGPGSRLRWALDMGLGVGVGGDLQRLPQNFQNPPRPPLPVARV